MTSADPSNEPVDLARQLQDLFERGEQEPDPTETHRPSAVAEATPVPPPEAPAPTVEEPSTDISAAVLPVLADLQDQLELLRRQLDTAFDEVDQRFAAQERGILSLASSSAGHQERLGRIETLVERSAAAVDKLSSTTEPVAARVEALGAEVTSRVRDHQTATRADLEKLADALSALRGTPVAVDTRRLEETVGRASIANSADIANLHADLAAIADAVRRQDDDIKEMREQLAWIKQRLLGR